MKANPKEDATKWLGDRSMWDDPSECSKKAEELTRIMGNKHNMTKIIHQDEHDKPSDKTCKGSFTIELG